MKNNHRQLLVHTCDIERPTTYVSTATIRDRQVSYSAVKTSVPCWFESVSTNYDFNDHLGQVPVKIFTVHFLGGEDVREGDRLKKGSDYYLVKGVQDNSDQGFHVVAQVEKKPYAMTT